MMPGQFYKFTYQVEEKGKEYKLQWQATASFWHVFSEICKFKSHYNACVQQDTSRGDWSM